jgi:hypothetical protein
VSEAAAAAPAHLQNEISLHSGSRSSCTVPLKPHSL